MYFKLPAYKMAMAEIRSSMPDASDVGIHLEDIHMSGDLQFNVVGLVARRKAVRVLSQVGIDLLAKAISRTPYDTGELRRSGTLEITYGKRRSKRVVVAQGMHNSDSVNLVNADITNAVSAVDKRSQWISMEISFNRMSDDGKEDVALWCHEDLLPYEARPQTPAARNPGTGPKFLESAYNENIHIYLNTINREMSHKGLSQELQGIIRLKKVSGKYTVDIRSL